MDAESLLEKEDKLSAYIRLFCIAGEADSLNDNKD